MFPIRVLLTPVPQQDHLLAQAPAVVRPIPLPLAAWARRVLAAAAAPHPAPALQPAAALQSAPALQAIQARAQLVSGSTVTGSSMPRLARRSCSWARVC